MYHILIADDSEEFSDFLSLLLRLNHYSSWSANNKDELMQCLEASRPDLILMDVIFKTHDGREVCREIKQQPGFKTIPVILVSASPEYLYNFQECMASACIEKPFDIGTILHLIQQHLLPLKTSSNN
jgi:CheY-like chemotaxis protein